MGAATRRRSIGRLMLDQQGGCSAQANATAPTLKDLVDHLRAHAETDVQLAQRVAMACCFLIDTKVDPIPAICAELCVIATPDAPDLADRAVS